ncbi:MAG: hypothetical protein A2408_00865 [Candidatus Yonathbacteria bacterium RIFOXYC1_FULL_52_10]|nr:MAG: hypothetical protein A2408_00865 [Candidatus Yonathbacteria bacterium RIFOXYC1_FULL_52_10]
MGISSAEAVVKVLVNSRHAYSQASGVVTQLLGSGYLGNEIIVHSTNLNGSGGYSLCCTPLFDTTATYYDHNGAAVASQAPYQIYSSSFNTGLGDTVTQYNLYDGVDLTHNLALTTSPNNVPPSFITAPGGGGWASRHGVEWTIDPTLFCVSTLSCLTGANAGIMAVLRYQHPAWNWYDVKAAMRQTGTNWDTGYDATDYGFGQVNHATATAFTDAEIFLQSPSVATSTNSLGQLTFTVYPFKQTRRVKEVLFQFSSSPGFQANQLTLSEIQALGGTKITEYTGTTATSTAPIYTAFTNAYFVWFTADNATDASANFSRIDTYAIHGPYTQSEIHFSSSFSLSSPSDGAAASVTPTFTWGAPTSYLGVSHYQLYVDGVLDKDIIVGTSTTPTATLSEGTHTWYIKAVNGGGTATSSASTRTITVISGYESGYTFYVDNVLGSDSNTGTQAAPWATIAKARSLVGPGDTVVIVRNAGTPYRETLSSATQTATASQRITFRGVSTSSKPEIWASDDISDSWTTYGGGNADTYQRALTTDPWIVATGVSISNLTKRGWNADAASLEPGEWYWGSNVLYYRLASGEDINTFHAEAGARSYGIGGASYTTYQNIVVRYANTAGVNLSGSTAASLIGIEVYDSTTGFNFLVATSPTIRDCVATANDESGIYSTLTTGLTVHRCLLYGNGGSGLTIAYTGTNASIKNNLFSGNGSRPISFTSPSSMTGFTADYNVMDDVWQSAHTAYRGTGNTESVTPLFLSAGTGDFRPANFSPGIDSGTTISGVTTDALGNPIYGTPDAGPYEYQPSYTIGTHRIPVGGVTSRIYRDGKYRPTTATSTEATADLRVTPSGGFGAGNYDEWMNVAVSTWQTEGAYRKVWTESSSIATTTAHTVGDLAPGGQYRILVDGVEHSRATANASGQLTFDYGGGYSTHTFEVNEAVVQGGVPSGAPSGGGQSTLPDPVLVPTATTTTVVATSTTTPVTATSSKDVLQTQIRTLQEQLVVLLHELVKILVVELQKAGKTLY